MPAASSRLPGQAALWTTAGYLFVSLLFGGGTRQGLWGDALLNLLALPLLAWAIWRSHLIGRNRCAWLGVAVLGAIATWNLLQLVPLPPAWWTTLAGRAELAAELQVAGIALGARPISLDFEAGLRATLSLLPPLAVGLMALGLRSAQRRRLLQLVLALALAALVLGLVQIGDGSDSPLRWQSVKHTTEAVGPFANRNHLASLVVLALPLAVAQVIVASLPVHDHRSADRRRLWLAAGCAGLVLLLLGLAIARSRAGVALAALALLPSALMLWRRHSPDDDPRHGLKRWLLAGFVVGLLAAIQFGFWRLAERFEADPMNDLRWTITRTTLAAGDHFGRLGVGAGGFVAAYQSVEPADQRGTVLINRAHNDWAEWRLEGGWPLLGAVGLGLVLLAWCTFDAWRERGENAVWRRASAIGLWLLLVHSFVEYPLRTTAIGVVAAVLCAHLLAKARS